MTFHIRIMNPQDLPTVFDLWNACEGVGLAPGDEEASLLGFLKRNLDSNFVAEKNGELIGAILGGQDGRRGWLYHLAISQPYRGNGLAKQLIDGCLAAFRSAGIKRCSIFVFADNCSGIDFWKHLGWQGRPDLVTFNRDV